MSGRATGLVVVLIVGAMASSAHAWDHGGHMASASIAFAEIERSRPDLIEKIGRVLLAHPDPAPFAVAAGESSGKGRVRHNFIECARWPDDARFTIHDRPVWHTARWALVAEDAPPEAKAAAAARAGKPSGQAIESLILNYAVLSNPEAKPAERATALCWVLHVTGDIHQPMHVTDLFSKQFPAGNAAGTLSYVADPLRDSTMPLHMLWDSNTLRSTELEEIDRRAREYTKKHPPLRPARTRGLRQAGRLQRMGTGELRDRREVCLRFRNRNRERPESGPGPRPVVEEHDPVDRGGDLAGP